MTSTTGSDSELSSLDPEQEDQHEGVDIGENAASNSNDPRAFSRAVYDAVRAVPVGRVTSYG